MQENSPSNILSSGKRIETIVGDYSPSAVEQRLLHILPKIEAQLGVALSKKGHGDIPEILTEDFFADLSANKRENLSAILSSLTADLQFSVDRSSEKKCIDEATKEFADVLYAVEKPNTIKSETFH